MVAGPQGFRWDMEGRSLKKRLAIAVVLTAGVLGLCVPGAAAHSAHGRQGQGQQENGQGHDGQGHDQGHDGQGHGSGNGAQVVIDGLNNPRQITVRGSSVYVAEAGTGGDTCFDVAPGVNVCAGLTGSVARYRHGDWNRIQTGLLSIASPEGDVVGVDALDFRGYQLYGIATGGCTAPGFAIPPELAAQAGHLLRLNGGTSVTPAGDPGTFECTNDPDGQGPDTDPYGLAFRGRTAFVADAAGNDIVTVKDGQTALAKVLSTNSQPVPTSLAWGPDHALYIGTLNFEAGPGGAAVLRLDPRTGVLSTYASGLTAVTSLTFGDHGRLYVTEWTTGFDANGPLPNGDVVSIPWGGGTNGRQVIGGDDLHFPTGIAIQDGSLYVSNWGIAAGTGPGPHGQLVRFAVNDHHQRD
jgi:hypothetical protein